jgi:hypothetical protein
MKIKLPEIKAETLWKAASFVFMVGGAIVTNQINKQNQEANNKKIKDEIIEELYKEQNS